MEEINTLCDHEESISGVKNKLISTTLQLESLKMNAELQRKEHEKTVQQYKNLLSIANQERDEAIQHLHYLLGSFVSSGTPDQLSTNVLNPHLQPQSPLSVPPINFSLSGSNSETCTLLSNDSSPVDSLFDAFPSPDLLNLNLSGSSNKAFPINPYVQDHTGSTFASLASPGMNNLKADVDRADVEIEKIVQGKELPQPGNLFQTMKDSGPLLQTILVTGLLPQWRNPPPFLQALSPQASIRGDHVVSPHINKEQYENLSCLTPRPSNLSSAEKHRRSSPAIREPKLKTSGLLGSGLSHGKTSSSSGVTSSQNLRVKRKMM
ncbi:hypothetical protein Tsubulata_039575 [Turnera subulata]|uniref:Uncharacterized protein n=1 Tax=Turnera subulata TaxID=218843 RepID=A0A9Q0FKY9_9ROSI|nr:hypothetical protein Tsubulata_039575 [Turnera subulata]